LDIRPFREERVVLQDRAELQQIFARPGFSRLFEDHAMGVPDAHAREGQRTPGCFNRLLNQLIDCQGAGKRCRLE
jgi:hypothetical protein